MFDKDLDPSYLFEKGEEKIKLNRKKMILGSLAIIVVSYLIHTRINAYKEQIGGCALITLMDTHRVFEQIILDYEGDRIDKYTLDTYGKDIYRLSMSYSHSPILNYASQYFFVIISLEDINEGFIERLKVKNQALKDIIYEINVTENKVKNADITAYDYVKNINLR